MKLSNQRSCLAFAALALVVAGCQVQASGEIPCVEDLTCPDQYPVCGPAGHCIAGSRENASVAIVGPEGYMPTELVAGTVRMLVTARATTGVASVTLASGATSFPASATPAAAPLYAFDIDTTALPDGDVPLTATVAAGDGSTGGASGTLHVGNGTVPSISSFTFQGGGTTATFAPGADVVLAHVYGSAGGTATINGVPAAASGSTTTLPNIQSTTIYTLTVTGAGGLSVTRSVTANVSAQITSFRVGASLAASSGTTTITSGATTALFASYAGRGSSAATLSCAPSCSGTLGATTIASGGTASVSGSVAGALTYTLTVPPSSGPNATATVTVNVVPPANAVSLSASSSVVHQGGSVTLTPTFNFGSSPAVPGSATIVGSDGSTFANVVSGTGIQVAPAAQTTTYTLHVVNGAGTHAATSPTATIALSTGAWSAFNTDTIAVIRGATVTALDNGKVLIAGGMNLSSTPVSTAYVCDATGSCVAKSMGTPRAFHTAVKVGAGAANNAGKVLLAGGYTAAGPATPTSSAELYDPVADSFGPTTAITTATVTSARARHIAVQLGDTGIILIAGGTNGTADLNTALEYDAGTAATPATANVSNTMAQPRASFSGTLLGNGTVLIVGGKTGTTTAELFDPAVGSGTFAATAALPAGEDKRHHTAVLLIGVSPNAGKVLISGGVTGAGNGTPSSTQFLYDRTSATFDATAPALATPRSNHAAIELANTNVLICGGTSDGTNTLRSCELFDHAGGSGVQLPTADMIEFRKDFALAPMKISSFTQIIAAGSPSTPMNFAEAYDEN